MSRGVELSLRGISKRFGGSIANDDVSFDLHQGEILGVIGPNGAGKTTTLNIVSGLIAPDAGQVVFRGEDVTGLPAHRLCARGLMRTFQTPRTFGTLSVEDNLLVQSFARLWPPAGPADRKEAAARAQRLLDMTGLAAMRDAKAKELSGGQQALLQAATGFMNPALSCYLLDEAFSGINQVLTERLVDLILRERETSGISFLVVSHEMPTIRRLCDRVIVMANATVLAQGSLDEVSANQAVVSAYLGEGETA
jgi:branched-chain amino acid transport system ATP-binding protein